jgi:hypothetical protein
VRWEAVEARRAEQARAGGEVPPPPPEAVRGNGGAGRAEAGLPEELELDDGVGGDADAERGATEPPRGEEAVGADGLLSVGTRVGGGGGGTADTATRGGCTPALAAGCRGGRVVTIDIGASPYTGVRLDLGPREIWLVTTRNDLSATRFLIHPVGASIVIIAPGR